MSSLVYPTLPGLMYPVKRTPVWSHPRPQESVSGKESRVRFYVYPRWRWTLAYEFLSDPSTGTSELKQLVGIFNAHAGNWDSFLFSDPDFNSATAEQFGTGDGTTTAFQITAKYQNAGGPGAADVIQNFNGAPQIFKAGVLQTVSTHYTLGPTGIVTFTSAPTAGQALTWTGSFYYRVRFDTETLDVEKFMNQMWSARAVKLISVKL